MMKTNQIFGVAIEFCTCYEDVLLDRGEIEKIVNAPKRYDENQVLSNERLENREGWSRKYEDINPTTITIIMTSLFIMDIKGKNKVF